MDIIYLRDLRVDAKKIEFWEWERLVLQTLVIDLDFALDIGVASSTDDLKDTVDYKAIGIVSWNSSAVVNLIC